MFGYLKPVEGELLVKHHELYRALYCGLCRTIRKKVSFSASLALNYDFVFLALLRAEVTGETFSFCQKRCPVHPLKKRGCTRDESEALTFTALVHLALVWEKLRDDLRDPDTPLTKRLSLLLLKPALARSVRKMTRREPHFAEILRAVSDSCERLYALEQAGCRDLDELAFVCSEALEKSFSVGLSGDAKRLMSDAAATLGRLIYLLDACDDLEQDSKRGAFNPLLFDGLEAARRKRSELNLALSMYAKQLDSTTALIVKPNRYGPICENITKRAIPQTIARIVTRTIED